MAKSTIPTVDLCPLFGEGDELGRAMAIENIALACSHYGFFQIVNHGVPSSLMGRAIKLSKTFFQYPAEEKLKSKPIIGSEAPLPAGYNSSRSSDDLNEYVLMFSTSDGSIGAKVNVYPPDPPEFREVAEEISSRMNKTAALLQGILNECLGLPHNFLKNYNDDRSADFMTMIRYFPATETENNGLSQHEDPNILTFVFQDEVGGLEVLKDGEWIPVTPTEGTIVVNVGDVIQVLTNKKFKSATHRVVRKEGRSRYSCCFFYNLAGDKWVEPLPKFTAELGESPNYRGFLYNEYLQLRMRNKSHPPSKPEDVIHISYYDKKRAVPVDEAPVSAGYREGVNHKGLW